MTKHPIFFGLFYEVFRARYQFIFSRGGVEITLSLVTGLTLG